ncbi:SGF29 tudor-like domain-containing protein [Cadophora sp. MPI-SDFR-AT-0126]|nr:SGF29 tudor-like domain-containing protein [Leotiomycetes sp. MPI-SDFR-AT-0126]
MSSQRRGAPRNGTRGGSDDNVINRADIADEIRRAMIVLAEGERKAKSLKDKIIVLEQRMRKKKDDGLGVSISDHTELEALYREQVKIAEEQKVRATDESILTRIRLLADVQKSSEQEEGLLSARNSSSRTSGIDFDGPSDSPVPSPADNRHVRKIGGSRTSSQPPRSNTDKLDGTASEASERASKPKIMYSLKEEVAFKRKLPGGKPEDQDWIQGEVVRVIGEGKSRRYDVKDIDPDAVGGSNIYKSSASQMVPIPPEGTPLGDYEPGKQVLALYPAATTFYRAQVKSMVDGGARVMVLFEEEDVEKSIARRFVLDHKG